MSQSDDFVRDFLIESQEGLDQLDSDLVAVESSPDDKDHYDSAFRVLHTIKGNAGFLDFPVLGSLAHSGETLLGRLRNGDCALGSHVIDALLELLDSSRAILKSIESSGTEGDASYKDLEATLQKLAAGEDVAANPRQPESDIGASEVDDTELDSQVAAMQDQDSDLATPTVTFPRGHFEAAAEEQSEPESKPVKSSKGRRKQRAKAPVDGPEEGKPADAASAVDPAATIAPKSKPPKARKSKPSKAKKSEPPKPPPTEPKRDVESPDAADRKPAAERSADSSIPSRVTPPAAAAASSLVRVDVELLDRLMNLVGELVLARNQIVEIVSNRSDPELVNPIQRLNLLTTDLQEGVLKTRMQQIGTIWQRYHRMVRDFAKLCGKEIELQLSGEETELDKTLVESIKDPLVHLIRNAIDHGIEKPYLRKVKKKPRTGLLSLKASHEAGQVVIEITDDGSGLDLKRIRQKAVERGLFTESDVENLQDRDVHEAIFMPGFSTADRVSDVSGRGVGMDVVKTHIERVGGTIEIDSEKDVGTTFRLTVPLTLAIIPALIVTAGGQRFSIPQTNVVEMLTLRTDSGGSIEMFHDTPVLRLRGEILPIVSLGDQLQIDGQILDTHNASIMVLKTGTRQFALMVDAIGNSEEIVVKPFGQVLEGMSEYGGATIMGDGSVALILDVRGFAERASLFATDRSLLQAAARKAIEERKVVAENALLVAEIGERHRVGLPLGNVVRLEELPAFHVEISNGREVIQYRGELLSLIRVRDVIVTSPTMSDPAPQPDTLSIVVYQHGEHSVGLVVHRIVDIAEQPERIRLTDEPGLINGTAVALGCVTDLIDVSRLMDAAGVPMAHAT
jgi:two-component system chemotaxis sensor kinase CheA